MYSIGNFLHVIRGRDIIKWKHLLIRLAECQTKQNEGLKMAVKATKPQFKQNRNRWFDKMPFNKLPGDQSSEIKKADFSLGQCYGRETNISIPCFCDVKCLRNFS